MTKSTGYSGTPLVKKLGFAVGASIAVIGAPPEYEDWVAPLPVGARLVRRLPATPTAVHLFVTQRAELARRLTALRASLDPGGYVWVSWPKKAAKVETDVTEDVIRAVALPMGFVDVKVCAVSERWSGLKLVIRLSERPRA
jgi:hypothetical protein